MRGKTGNLQKRCYTNAAWTNLHQWAVNDSYRVRLDQEYRQKTLILELHSVLKDAETAQRGYIITGQPEFLKSFTTASDSVRPYLAALVQSWSQDARHSALVPTLSDLIQRRLELLQQRIVLKQNGDAERASALIATGEGSVVMSQIRDVIGKMEAAQEGEIQDYQVRYNDSLEAIRHIRYLMGITLTLLSLGSIVTIFLLERRNRRLMELAELQRWQVSVLYAIADKTNASRDLAEALAGVSGILETVFPQARAWATLAEQDRDDATSIEGAPVPSSAVRTEVPVRAGGMMMATLVCDVPKSSPHRGVTIKLVMQYAQLQLEQAAERQLSHDSLVNTLARQQAIFSAALNAIVTFNAEGAIESMNPAAEKLLGISKADAAGLSLSRFLEDGGLRGARALAALENAPLKVHEIQCRRPDNQDFAAEVEVNRIEESGRAIYVASIRDVTAYKKAERLKSEFVSTVSHELRTPLTSIAGSLALLKSLAKDTLPPHESRLISIAHRNSERLGRLVNDILEIEKIESMDVPFRMAPVSFGRLAQQAVDDIKGYADACGVRLILVLPSTAISVYADPDRLLQVLTNLISNAVKFSPEGAPVLVDLGQRNGRAILTVKDKGPGIPLAFQPQMFRKFAQADGSDSRVKGGTGLGLSIVKQIVDRLGGKITFKTAPETGTSFFVEMPLCPEEVNCEPALQAQGG